MKILFISDIHGVCDNLNVVENKFKEEKIDKLVVLGDLYYCGPTYALKYQINSIKVKDFLEKYKDILICTKGNCDSEVDMKVSDFPIVDLGLIHADGIDFYITHGNKFNRNKNEKLPKKGVLIYGHEHIPYIKQIQEMTYINVGSISLPKNNYPATYMIYDNRTFTIYDLEGNIIESIKI